MARSRHLARKAMTALALWLCLAGPLPAQQEAKVLLREDFERDPIKVGWTGVDGWKTVFAGEWTDTDAAAGKHSYVVHESALVGPAFAVEPFALYRVAFAAKTASRAYWAMQFFDDAGKELVADHYAGIDPSDDWQRREFFLMARKDAATARLRFQPIGAALAVDEAEVRAAERPEAWAWLDQVFAGLPPLAYRPEPGRWQHLAETQRKLLAGEELRVVVLGDSIANDLSGSLFHLLVERQYPGARLRLIHSVRSATGCLYYQHRDRVRPYVLDHRPDLVIIGGISHGLQVRPIRRVIRQVHAESKADILVLTGAVRELGMNKFYGRLGRIPPPAKARAITKNQAFRGELALMTAAEKVGYLDLRAAWEDYVGGSGKPLSWFQRDMVHANVRGKQAMARILARFLAPEEG